MRGIKIGELAKKLELNIETIRYYERRGLIPLPPRKKLEFGSHPGFRLYPEDTIQRIHFIQRAKELGFSLKEILRLLSIADGNESNCQEVFSFATKKKSEIEKKINDLKHVLEMLNDLSGRCQLDDELSGCPIIESLSKK